MAESNRKPPQKKKRKKRNILKIFFTILILVMIISVGAVGGIVIGIVRDAPDIDPTNISSLLNQTSFILDENGKVIEKIQTEENEYRTIVTLDKIPDYLQNAFISIEDERFNSHIGVDPKGIVSSLIDNAKAGHTVRGASTITQQLARNLYLSDVSHQKTLDRKIKEAYLALQIEKALTKDQVMEAYLNRIYLGQGAYGVQEAAQTYFSKSVEDLTIGESAALAGIVKGPSTYSLYHAIKPEDFNEEIHAEIGQIDQLGENYIAVYNEEPIKRQKLVLAKMLELEYISEEEYDNALEEDIKANLKPGQKKIKGISSYFNDYIKVQVVDTLMIELGYSKEEAQAELYTGGLKIYSSMDLELQQKLEDTYDNFTEVLLGGPDNIRGPALVNWRLSEAQNIIDDKNHTIYYKQENILDDNFNLLIENGSFEILDGKLVLNNGKLTPFSSNIQLSDYYTIDSRKNLVTHRLGALSLPEDEFSVTEEKAIVISEKFLNDNPDFYSINEAGHLLINEKYFYRSKEGVVQPQSATVVMDYRSGQIKALVGGRDVEGSKILNRAISPRQPGSTIKPLAAYLPALDNGFTAASPIDDIPFSMADGSGDTWQPNNWNFKFTGIQTLRHSVEQSININSIKAVESIGIPTSIEYLSRMGIINKDDPSKDSFVTRSEDQANNDENLSSLGLGGMTKGLTPLEVTAAFGSIANSGTYTKPIAFTKILDQDGLVLIDNTPKTNTVVSPEIAFIMSDILRTTVSDGIARRAQIPNMPTAGKTGTTQDKSDAWFVGYTPYYVTGLWIGNDSPQIKLTEGSSIAAELWRIIMTDIHESLEAKNFDKPANIVTVNVCTQSGKLATDLCHRDPRGNTVQAEIFAQGTQPTGFCETHVELSIDTATNKIANEYCPEGNVETRVFIQRNPPYNPEEHGGVVPEDYQHTAPTEVCDLHNRDNTVDEWLKDELEDEEDEDEDEDVNGGDDPNKNDDNIDNNENNNDLEDNDEPEDEIDEE